jgi:hypothetical protein
MKFKRREINDLQIWRRGWDTQSSLGTIPSCFQQHAQKTAWILAISMLSPVATVSTLPHE